MRVKKVPIWQTPVYQCFETQNALMEIGVDPLKAAQGVGKEGNWLKVKAYLGNRFVCVDQDNYTHLKTAQQIQRWFS